MAKHPSHHWRDPGLHFIADRSNRGSSRRQVDDAAPDTGCGVCDWSLCAGNDGTLVCMKPESPHCYDVVDISLGCEHQGTTPG
jgi:hypothetical protein